jgi:hypothetical protein
MRHSARLGAVAALAVSAASLGGCMSTSTYGTGSSPEMAILDEISGGLTAKKKASIDYQPRAPLVLPPSTQLREPAQSAAASNAAWPSDPDQRVAGSSNFDPETNPEGRFTQADSARVAPLAGVMTGRGNAQERRLRDPERDKAMDVVHRQNMNKEFKAALDEKNGVGVTERRYLTDPPEAYREPAGTAPTEFAEIEKKKKGFFSRMFGG